MGEIADDMIDGTTCSWCGQFFQDPKHAQRTYTHGYPVVCKDCYNYATKAERKDVQEAIVDTI